MAFENLNISFITFHSVIFVLCICATFLFLCLLVNFAHILCLRGIILPLSLIILTFGQFDFENHISSLQHIECWVNLTKQKETKTIKTKSEYSKPILIIVWCNPAIKQDFSGGKNKPMKPNLIVLSVSKPS